MKIRDVCLKKLWQKTLYKYISHTLSIDSSWFGFKSNGKQEKRKKVTKWSGCCFWIVCSFFFRKENAENGTVATHVKSLIFVTTLTLFLF